MSDNITIKNWAIDDRPREKLVKNGAASLSNAELLAILIATGSGKKTALDIGREIMNLVNNDLVKFVNITPKQLENIKGIGPAKAITIAAAMELGIRIKVSNFNQVTTLNSISKTAAMLQNLYGHYSYEVFAIVYLNKANKILANEIISEGGITNTLVDVRLIFKSAMLYNATAIILCHNHPSGDTNPSKTDYELTARIIASGKVLEITILDHIVVSQDGYFSMLQKGTLPKN